MPPPLLINPLKIRVAQQSPTPWETNLFPPRSRSVRLFLGSDSAHGNRLVEFPDRGIPPRKRKKRNQRESEQNKPAEKSPPRKRVMRTGVPCVPLWLSFSSDYSRKPGFTETRLRPLARRRDSTFCPPWVFMRVRKPCFFDRLRRLGWNVRLGMKSTCS